MGKITFTEEGWADYTCWQTQEKRTLRRVNQLLQDILRGGYEGIGKPEPLKGDLRTCIHNHPIPSGRLFFRPAVLKILELHQVVLRIFALQDGETSRSSGIVRLWIQVLMRWGPFGPQGSN